MRAHTGLRAHYVTPNASPTPSLTLPGRMCLCIARQKTLAQVTTAMLEPTDASRKCFSNVGVLTETQNPRQNKDTRNVLKSRNVLSQNSDTSVHVKFLSEISLVGLDRNRVVMQYQLYDSVPAATAV